MGANNIELTERLFEAVDTIVGERISALPYDQTIVCQIVDTSNYANGIYKVTHDHNTIFTAYADYTGYEKGDFVYVRIPEGDYTKQKVISGKFLDGIIVSNVTQNIIASPNQSYYVFNKENQIYDFYETTIEREISFQYFNTQLEKSANNNWKTWLNALSEYKENSDTLVNQAASIKILFNDIEVAYIIKVNPPTGASFFGLLIGNSYVKLPDISDSNYLNNIVKINVSNFPNLSEAYLVSDGNSRILLRYKVASSYDINNSVMTIKAKYCPNNNMGNTMLNYNIEGFSIINFGYKPEFKDDINVVFKLWKIYNNTKEVVPAILQNNPNGTRYELEIIIYNKDGQKVNLDNFDYHWERTGGNEIIIASETIGLQKISLAFNNYNVSQTPLLKQPIIFSFVLSLKNNVQYKTFYYPIAVRTSELYISQCPNIITYDTQGLNPTYLTGPCLIKNKITKENKVTTIVTSNGLNHSNNVIFVKSYYTADSLEYIAFIDNNGKQIWYQSFLVTKKPDPMYGQLNIYTRNGSSATLSNIVTAKVSDKSGLIIDYNNQKVTIDAYCFDSSKGKNGSIFKVSSSGDLTIGYDKFLLNGGAKFLSTGTSDNLNKYKVGEDGKHIIYFEDGIPKISTQSIGSEKSFIYLSNGQFTSKEIINNNNKILPDLITSKIQILTNAHTFNSITENGFFFNVTSPIQFTIPKGIAGVEFELVNTSSGSITLKSTNNCNMCSTNDKTETKTLIIEEKYGVIAAKYITDSLCLITGAVQAP